MKALVPETGFKGIGKGNEMFYYRHNDEGVDDMPAHIRTALTSNSLSLSIDYRKIALGTWQGIYLWEHRYLKNSRKLNLHVIGEIS